MMMAGVLCLALSAVAYGEVVWLEAGLVGDLLVDGTYEYEEVTFITGTPVVLRGTLKRPAKMPTGDKYTLTYQFELSDEADTISLERKVTYLIEKTQKDKIGQTTMKRTVTKYDESIKTPEGTFTLGKFRYNESRVFDNTLAVKYMSGNTLLEKTLYLNGDAFRNAGMVTVRIHAKPMVGYSHYYGEQEVLQIKQEIRSERPSDGSENKNWSGVVDIGLSSLISTTFTYQYTDPQNISFRGSYFKSTTDDNVVTYRADIDRSVGTQEDAVLTNRLSNRVVTSSEALAIPKWRDIGGIWSERNIMLTTALGAFDIQKEYFVPKAGINRLDFGKAMVITIHGALPEPTKTEITKRLRPGVETPYLDVLPSDPNYHYIEFIRDTGLMAGKNYYFKGQEPLTRAEAVVIMIQALGLDRVAPAPPYTTHFVDDDQIPEWAKDSIYMAYEVGLVQGTPEGYMHPNQVVTKEEVATMLTQLIVHLKDTITPDYREKILNR